MNGDGRKDLFFFSGMWGREDDLVDVAQMKLFFVPRELMDQRRRECGSQLEQLLITNL